MHDTVLMGPEGVVKLTQLHDAVVAECGWYTDTLDRADDGILIAHGGSWRGDWSEGAPWWCASRDGGVTWQPYAGTAGADHTRIRPNLCRCRNGSVVGWDDAWNLKTTYQGRPGQPTAQAVMRAASCDALIRGAGERIEASVHVPYQVPGLGDDLSQPPSYGAGVWGKLLEADADYLLQAAYGFFDFDRVPRLWQEQKAPAHQYRTWLLYSRDDGANWHYLSTVAASPQHPLPAQAEGYCEPDLLYFGDGRLLCVMRTGGNPVGRLMERYTPLVASRSVDGGLTWSAPEPIAAYGVAPMLLRMQSGLVVCLSGRPGFFLLFSTDEGKTWSPPHWLCESPGPWHQSASGYGQLIELEPGVLGVAYDDYVGEGDDARMVTKFRRYRVETTTEGG